MIEKISQFGKRFTRVIRDTKSDSPEKRRQEIEPIKVEMIQEQYAIGLMLQEIYGLIYDKALLSFNPGLIDNKIEQVVQKFSQEYEFSKSTKKDLKSGLNKLKESASSVNAIKEQFQDNPDLLFKRCFDIENQNPLRVIYGYCTITFVLSIEDFYMLNKERKEESLVSVLGQAGGGVKDSTLSSLVNIVRESDLPNTSIAQTVRHEDQHALNKYLFSEKQYFLGGLGSARIIYEQIENIQGIMSEETKQDISKIFKEQFQTDATAKDELLAQLRGNEDVGEIEKVLKEVYIPKWEKNAKDIRFRLPSYYTDLPFDKMDEIIGNIFSNLASKTLPMAIGSIRDLEKNDFSKNEIVALLYGVPLDKWSAFVRRFLKSGLQKKSIFNQARRGAQKPNSFDLIVWPATIQ